MAIAVPRPRTAHADSQGVQVPDPRFPTKNPAGRRSSGFVPPPAPGGQPDHNHRIKGSSADQPRWARCSDDQRLHLLQPADVIVAAAGQAQAVCGNRILPEDLTIVCGGSAALCIACIIGAISAMPDAGPRRPS